MKTKIVYSEKCLGYGTWHIEGPQRVKIAHDVLKAKGYEFVEPSPADDWELFGIHDADYLFNVKKGLVEDSDTPAYHNIYEFARLSVGSALLASKINGFSLMRPPGHHVGRNGAALGVLHSWILLPKQHRNSSERIRKTHLDPRTLMDTMETVHKKFFKVTQKYSYVSLHQSPNYPGTGNFTEGNCINFALPGDLGGKRYLETLDKALGMVDLAKFEAVAVSAGFDTHQGDLATLGLLTKIILRWEKKLHN